MPWNMFINAQDYFRFYKLNSTNIDPSIDQSQVASLQTNFLPYLTIASQVPNVLFNGLNLLVNFGSGNLKLRVNLTLIVELIIFAITISLALVDSSKWPVVFFYSTMLSVAVLNMASGIYQNCIFGTGAIFPTGSYINAILIGSNLSGTFTASVNLLAILLAPEPQIAATYYFIAAVLVIIICLVSYNLLSFNKFFNHYEKRAVGGGHDDSTELSRSDFLLDKYPTVRSSPSPPLQSSSSSAKEDDTSFKAELRKKWLVFKKCWIQCLNIFLTFFVTLCLFPSVLADIKEGQVQRFGPKFYTPFACFFLFNVFAMIGNLLPALTTWPGKNRVWLVVLARFAFIPFFLFCNFRPETRKWPIIFHTSWVFMAGNILFALTSGYLSSICMMFASNNLPPEEARKAGMLAAFFLVFGIFVGVSSSSILALLVEL